MDEKHTTACTPKPHVPYDPKSKAATLKYWKDATAHCGVAEPRIKRGRPSQATGGTQRTDCIARGQDVMEWCRDQGGGWQTRMNTVLKAFRDAAS